MSLIQDALRRQMEEQEKQSATPSPQNEPPASSIVSTAMKLKPIKEEEAYEPASSPQETQDAAQDEPASIPQQQNSLQKSKRYKMLIAIAIIVVLLGGGFYYVWLPMLFEEKPEPKKHTVQKVEENQPIQPKEIAVKEPSQSAVSEKDNVPAPQSAQSRSEIAAPQEGKVVEQTTTTASKPSEKSAKPVSFVTPQKTTTEPSVPLIWPDLKLSGVLKGISQKQGAARINGKMVFIGDEIEGVTLLEIKDNGVILKYGNETKFLKVGGILY